MRGYPLLNFPAFDEAAEFCEESGWEAVNPAAIDRALGVVAEDESTWHLGGGIDECMRRDLKAICDVDAIVLLKGWEQSEGTAHELNAAAAIGLAVLYYDEQCPGILDFEPPHWPGSAGRERDAGEVRVVNATTGGAKGSKLAQFSLLPQRALKTVAEHYGIGAAKYDRHNWRKGYDWSLSFDALQRHANQFWAGEDVDPETQSPHMAAVAFHALALLTFMSEHPELDDRFKSPVPTSPHMDFRRQVG